MPGLAPGGRIVLGLDLAQSTGWALARDGEIYASGAVKLPWSKDNPGSTVAESYRRIQALVGSFGPLDLVAVEDVQFASRRMPTRPTGGSGPSGPWPWPACQWLGSRRPR